MLIPTPYFVKAKPKRGRKKRGPNGRGSHLGLEVLGLIGRGSPVLVGEVVKMAVLCPSFEIAKEMLAGRGIQMDVSTIRRFCRQLAEKGMRFREQMSLERYLSALPLAMPLAWFSAAMAHHGYGLTMFSLSGIGLHSYPTEFTGYH